MPLQFVELHVSANSKGSRNAFGERSFSARSRWHTSTSLSASSRFAFASASVSPCEMAAGTSSTKQVYPPSLAGSKTAVSFMPQSCHARPCLAISARGRPCQTPRRRALDHRGATETPLHKHHRLVGDVWLERNVALKSYMPVGASTAKLRLLG